MPTGTSDGDAPRSRRRGGETGARSRTGIERLLHPESVAIIGASSDAAKVGGKVRRHALAFGFTGSVFLVTPGHERIGDVPCYPDVRDLPAPVDVAVVCLPAPRVIPAVAACGEAGVGTAVVLSAGFAETGDKGRRLQQELVDVAAAAGVRLLGPNCLGLLNVERALALSFSSTFEGALPPAGPLAVVAQSGALAASVLTMLREAELGLGWWITTGNEADITWLEIAESLLAEEDIRQLAIYAEGMHDGGRLLDLGTRALALGKQVILLSAGTSREAAGAVLSHSGSLGSPAVLVRGLMSQAGILEAGDLPALVEASSVFRHGRAWRAGGVGVLTTSGGAGIMLVDACARLRLPVAALQPSTRERLAAALPEFAATANPVDVTGAAMYRLGMLREPFRALAADPDTGAVAILLTLVTGKTAVALAEDIVVLARTSEKPVLVAWLAGDMARDAYAVLRAAGIPLFFSVTACADALAHLWRYERRRRTSFDGDWPHPVTGPDDGVRTHPVTEPAEGDQRHPVTEPAEGDRRHPVTEPAEGDRRHPVTDSVDGDRARPVTDPLDSDRLCPTTDPSPGLAGIVTETPAKELLRRYGIPVPAGARVTSPGAAEAVAECLGYPLVVKSESPDLPHRAQGGAVRLGIHGKVALRRAYREVVDLAGDPAARIERMAEEGGLELLVGGRVDPTLGPFVLLGLGGEAAELIDDVVARRAPIAPEEVAHMLDELAAGPRIRASLDDGLGTAALFRAVARISRLIGDLEPRLVELDVNPLLVPRGGGDVIALDALVILRSGDPNGQPAADAGGGSG